MVAALGYLGLDTESIKMTRHLRVLNPESPDPTAMS
jgi:hypothetical protein